jgi:hypothetical protein
MTDFPHVSKTGKRYRYVSEGVREYESTGVQYDEGAGRIVKGYIGEDNAVTMQQASYESKIEKTQQRVGEFVTHIIASQEPDYKIDNPTDAIAVLWAKKAEQAYHKDDHASVRMAEGVTKMMGLWPAQVQPSLHIDNLTVNMDRRLAQAIANEIVEVEWSEDG